MIMMGIRWRFFFSGTFDQLLVIRNSINYTNQATPGWSIEPELKIWHHFGIAANFCPQYYANLSELTSISPEIIRNHLRNYHYQSISVI